jgi:hypothetical protein
VLEVAEQPLLACPQAQRSLSLTSPALTRGIMHKLRELKDEAAHENAQRQF